MYSRAVRSFEPASPNTADIGPGSYDLPARGVNVSRKPAPSPFSSSSDRQWYYDDNPTVLTPGPGSYNLSGSPKSSKGALLSRAPRLEENVVVSDLPGPGAYDTAKSTLRTETGPKVRKPLTISGTRENPSIRWERTGNPPSIPAPHQSYGYVDLPQGRLVPNDPPTIEDQMRTYERKGESRLTDTERYASTSAPSFARTSRRSDRNKEKDWIPGPGEYDVAKPELSDRIKQGATATFRSSSQRGIGVRNTDAVLTPGPGSYSLPSSINVRSGARGGRHAFGGSAPRFKTKAAVSSPGPGEYAISVREKEDVNVSRGILMGHAPFGGSATRFERERDTEITPGPGEYSGTSSIKSSNRSGTSAGFGGSSSRFYHKHADDEAVPGPGEYSPPRGATSHNPTGHGLGIGVTIPKPNTSPVVTRGRLAPRHIIPKPKVEEGPAPGSYDVSIIPSKVSFSKATTGSFGSSAKRFSEAKTNPEPVQNPWDADDRGRAVGAHTHKKPTKVPSSQLSFGSSPRFVAQTSETPGPGTYLAHKSMNKNSFNVTFDKEED